MKQGFSLVELSVVLVILGLIAGGILAGQSLIRAAELRGIVTDFNEFETAFGHFSEKYAAVPGDMVDATDFWSTGIVGGVLNGDGNGKIDTNPGERFNAWEHLSLAKLIQGNYPGANNAALAGCHNTADAEVPGCTMPAAPINQAGYFAGYTASMHTTSVNKNSIGFGAVNSGSSGLTRGVISPEEAWNIDTKIDDGHPGRGKLFALSSHHTASLPACLSWSNTAGVPGPSSEYLLDSDDGLCRLRRLLPF